MVADIMVADLVVDTMVVGSAEDTMAVAGAMVMEATTVIPVLVFTSAHLCILTTATLISPPIIIRRPSSPYR